MNIKDNIGKYLLGAFTGILIVAGCGGGGSSGGSGGVNTANGATITGVTAQLLCHGQIAYMSGTVPTPSMINCMSSTSGTPLTFTNFNNITQLGWVLVEVALPAPTGSYSQENIYIFQK